LIAILFQVADNIADFVAGNPALIATLMSWSQTLASLPPART
jgi:hypothetical protein